MPIGAHHPRWSFAPESGEGAAIYGGRFNRIGLAALYTSLRLETAWLEAQQGFVFKAQPMTISAYDTDCEGVADLTDPDTLIRLEISQSDLACSWEHLADQGKIPPSWSIADRLIESGYVGILVRSFAAGATDGDRNAIFWKWSNSPPHQVRVIDDLSRLPRNDASWR